MMVVVDSFNQECYEVLGQEMPEVIVKVTELIAGGCTPDQVEEIISFDIQDERSAIPLLAKNAACYLTCMTPLQFEPLVH